MFVDEAFKQVHHLDELAEEHLKHNNNIMQFHYIIIAAMICLSLVDTSVVMAGFFYVL